MLCSNLDQISTSAPSMGCIHFQETDLKLQLSTEAELYLIYQKSLQSYASFAKQIQAGNHEMPNKYEKNNLPLLHEYEKDRSDIRVKSKKNFH